MSVPQAHASLITTTQTTLEAWFHQDPGQRVPQPPECWPGFLLPPLNFPALCSSGSGPGTWTSSSDRRTRGWDGSAWSEGHSPPTCPHAAQVEALIPRGTPCHHANCHLSCDPPDPHQLPEGLVPRVGRGVGGARPPWDPPALTPSMCFIYAQQASLTVKRRGLMRLGMRVRVPVPTMPQG